MPMTYHVVLSLLFKLLNLSLHLKTLNSHLCYFLLNIVIPICYSTYFFDEITLCTNLPNVTLSNVSHVVRVTLFGETDGVTLSWLGCTSRDEYIYIKERVTYYVFTLDEIGSFK